eukprot:TRINITY_DN15136_c0_g1_i1.p1 TRINITY_DN15136_c0_g1~~TRINITY_DN15136_c0_g1_i1.p1  ORF type:complete len:423 (-),score=52.36 TRINITY_DN15136_c0_g1_i1:99-1367(-)
MQMRPVLLLSYLLLLIHTSSGWFHVPAFGRIPPRRIHQAGAVVENTFCIFGGRDLTILQDTWCFSLIADSLSWTELATRSFPQARYGHTAVAYLESMIVFGGTSFDGECLSSQASLVVNRKAAQWQALAPGPARTHHSAAILQHKMFVFGGSNSTSLQNDLWTYDFQLRLWQTVSLRSVIQPSPRQDAALVADTQRQFLWLFGGYLTDGTARDELWIFDAVHSMWQLYSTMTPAPSARFGASMFSGTNELLLFGGLGTDSTCWRDTWRLNTTCVLDSVHNDSCWSIVDSVLTPTARAFGVVATVDSSKGVLFGGFCLDTVIFDDVWLFGWSGLGGSILLVAVLGITGLIVLSVLFVVWLLWRWRKIGQHYEQLPLLATASQTPYVHVSISAAVVDQPGGATAVAFRLEPPSPCVLKEHFHDG